MAVTSDNPKGQALGLTLRVRWSEVAHTFSNPYAWLPTARMTFGKGEAKQVAVNRKGGFRESVEPDKQWVLFDRDYVVHWLAYRGLSKLMVIGSTEMWRLIKDAYVLMESGNGSELPGMGEVQTAEDRE